MSNVEGRAASSPRNLVRRAGGLRAGEAASGVAQLPWHCSSCGQCEARCPLDVPVVDEVLRARALVQMDGAWPAPASEIAAAFGVAGTPEGGGSFEALERMARAAEMTVTRSAEQVYLPGCVALHHRPAAAEAFLNWSRRLPPEAPRLVPGSAACCGVALAWAGELEGFAAHARRLARGSELGRARRVVVHDPQCADALKRLYPAVGAHLEGEVLTATALFAQAWRGRERRGGARRDRVAFAASCRERVDLRRLLERFGVEPIEVGEDLGAGCCGAAGLLPDVVPSSARALAEARVAAAEAHGSEVLVTSSPRCARHLASHSSRLPVLDLLSWQRAQESPA